MDSPPLDSPGPWASRRSIVRPTLRVPRLSTADLRLQGPFRRSRNSESAEARDGKVFGCAHFRVIEPVIATLAGMTIVTGNLMAIPQRNIKRMLAYSGIAHIGYMLIGLAALSSAGVAMVLFYFVAYLFGNMGAFMVVEAVARSEQSDGIDAYRGLAQRSPLLALAMLVFLLSLGGIPFVAGFWAKLYIFLAAAERGMYGLVFLGAVLTVVALYYYLLVARRMYIEAPTRTEPVPLPGLLGAAIAVCALGVVGIGVYPAPWLAIAQRVAATLF